MTINPRKWWHTTLRLLDRQEQLKVEITSKGDDPSLNGSDIIQAYRLNCIETFVPPTAFFSDESPGYFVYRPSLEDIGGEAGNNYVVPGNYDEVISINNRFIFEYLLQYAYDFFDRNCDTLGPPTAHGADPADVSQDETRGAVFYFPQLSYFDRIGCCEIDLTPPGDLLSPGVMSSNYRLWAISFHDDEYHLYTWDFSTTAPGGEDDSIGYATVERGVIRSSGSGTLSFHDIAWDDRDKLWGLEDQGLRQILPGDESTNAVALNYAQINDNFSGAASALLFPISTDSQGYPGMSFNQNNEKMYISANNYFFELEKISDAVWNISKYQNIGAGSELKDLAFDPYGQCYCVYNDNLCKINFTNAFGTIEAITEDGSFASVKGLDFVLDYSHAQLVNLYAVFENGQICFVDTDDGAQTADASAILEEAVVGASSAQPGENTRVAPFPFDPGASPRMFILDASGSMNSLDRWTTVIDGMVAFLENAVDYNDEIIIVTYSNTTTVSPRFVLRTQSDIDAAVEYLQGLPLPSGDANFCLDGPFSETFLQGYEGLRSIIVIGDRGFTGCPSGQDLQEYIQNVYSFAVNNGNPDLTMRAVGIFPSNLGQEHLTIVGSVGGGGYTEWF